MKQEQILTRSGFEITLQVISDECNHIYISDRNLYPDEDSRSQEWWRQSGNGLLIPINDKKDLNRIKKLFK
jgi:hypothetical protein